MAWTYQLTDEWSTSRPSLRRSAPRRFSLRFLAATTLVACSSAETSAPMQDAAAEVFDAAEDARLPRPGDPCSTRADCDDGIFCNGVEECLGGFCSSARNAACRDPGGCAVATCDEGGGGCAFDPSGSCSDGICRVDVGCTKTEGCKRDADCDDMRSCTEDRCDVATGSCVHLPRDERCPASGACGVGVCLGEEVADLVGCGTKPDASKCKSTEACDESLSCAPLKTSCTTDRDCTNGSLCDGVERCVLEGTSGHCEHGVRTTCVAKDACHHARCKPRTLGDPYCKDVKLPSCP